MRTDALVAGAGFSGATVARRLAEAGRKIVVVDPRSHLGGNAFDATDEHGVLVHRYGPHIFHTSSPRVVSFLSAFTRWRSYEHRVLSSVDGRLFPVPVNLDTVNRFFGFDLDEGGALGLLERLRVADRPQATAEDVFLATVGSDLYEAFFRGYSRKQWGRDPSELDAAVAHRIPVRFDRDDRYFTDSHQAMPADGYAPLFARMLDHPMIEIALDTDHAEALRTVDAGHLFFTGPLDDYFGRRLGALPYRSLRFEPFHLPGTARHQPVATVNFPGPEPFMRVTEFKHITGQTHLGTSLVREHPSAEGPPFYPVHGPESESLAKAYRRLAEAEPGVTFLGRLGRYAYLDMDRVVEEALDAADQFLERG